MYRYFLNKKLQKNSFIYFRRINSTYLYAKEHAAALCDRFTVIANTQSDGVGRRGKRFISNSKNGVYFTVVIKNAAQLKNITCAAAICVTTVIKSLYGKDTKIKWVNDIMLGDKKVCGILAGMLPNDGNTAVLGVGVNLAPPKGGFDKEISMVAGAVKNSVTAKEKAEFVASFLKEFDRIFKDGNFMKEYIARSYNVGKKVSFIQNRKRIFGVCDAVNGDGSLKVTTDGQEYNLAFGEVSVIINH